MRWHWGRGMATCSRSWRVRSWIVGRAWWDLVSGSRSARFALSRLVQVGSTDELEAVFTAARARRNEGLMVKDPTSVYAPGRRASAGSR